MLLGSLFAISAGIAGVFGGCAKGSEPPGTGGAGASGAGTSTGGTGGEGAGPVGGPCQTAQDCPDGGECIQIGGKKICTLACPPACPSGSYCTLIEGDPFCVPDVDQQCGQCLGSAQCKGVTDECLTAPAGDKFCARDCTAMDDCPDGFVCMERTEYLALGQGAGAGGSGGGAGGGGSAGGGGAGGNGGAGAGVGGLGLPDAGTPSLPGVPHRFCVPPDGDSCSCGPKRDGITKSCDQTNANGTCPGDESCDGKTSTWVGCTAKTPAAETCNAADDDCDGSADEADPNEMCGGAPPHAQWACNVGSCEIATCDPGWTQYPVGMPGDGCTCPMDASEPNDTCASPAAVGQVMDTGGALEISGTLSSDTDVDVWSFDAIDVDEMVTNSYHVSIDLAGSEGSEDILLDVIRGAACADAPTGQAVGITSYDWCVDGKSIEGTAGESPCAFDGPVHCNDHTSKYFVRVYRKAGAALACTPYKIAISAKGGDACDFSKSCQ